MMTQGRDGRLEKVAPHVRCLQATIQATRRDPAGSAENGRPFDSIESSHEYVGLLLQTIEETAADVGEEQRRTHSARATRRREAFQLIAYKLEQLRFHVATSRCLLNDLRTLRRMLHGERSADAAGRSGDERCA